MKKNYVIQTNNISKIYDGKYAANKINLTVYSGEIFGLIGSNGAGKSTLIKMLTSLMPVSDGDATVAGYSLRNEAENVRACIGYVPQMISSDGNLTAYENLLLSARLYNIPASEQNIRIKYALDLMQLSDVAQQLVHSYSGGMIRRLEIAQAMIHNPSILFLDEPTVGLDPISRHNVWQHIHNLRNNTKMTIFLSSHQMDEIEALCDRIGIMNRGHLIKIGTISELKSQIGAHATLDDVFINASSSNATITEINPIETASTIERVKFNTNILTYFKQAYAVYDVELKKLQRDPSELITRAFQPAIWLLLFGEVMANVRGINSPNISYLDFLAPGILAQSVLFSAIFYGISVIWERDLGILHRQLVSPAPRSALIFGKAISASLRGLSQAIIVYFLAFILGIKVSFNAVDVSGVVLLICIGSALFSTFSLIVACIVKTRDRFMGIGQVLTMPIFFASNAIYPIELMPNWLKSISVSNPLTYEVDGLRFLMLQDGVSKYGVIFDFGILTATTFILIIIAGSMYHRLTE